MKFATCLACSADVAVAVAVADVVVARTPHGFVRPSPGHTWERLYPSYSQYSTYRAVMSGSDGRQEEDQSAAHIEAAEYLEWPGVYPESWTTQ